MEKRREVDDLNELNEAFSPRSWVCSFCDQVNEAEDLLCRNIIETENASGPTYASCRGSQMHSWGGYVRGEDIRPVVSAREIEPNWRGRYTGGSKSQRVRAKLRLTEAEEAGQVDASDPVRAAAVEAAVAARRQVKAARRKQVDARYARKREALERDPFSWPCSQCYHKPDEGGWVYKDLMNFSTSGRCFRCSRQNNAEFEDVRWK